MRGKWVQGPPYKLIKTFFVNSTNSKVCHDQFFFRFKDDQFCFPSYYLGLSDVALFLIYLSNIT